MAAAVDRNTQADLPKPKGEIGKLERVEQQATIANGLFLWIEYDGVSYIG
jgi:hypothetical protein